MIIVYKKTKALFYFGYFLNFTYLSSDSEDSLLLNFLINQHFYFSIAWTIK